MAPSSAFEAEPSMSAAPPWLRYIRGRPYRPVVWMTSTTRAFRRSSRARSTLRLRAGRDGGGALPAAAAGLSNIEWIGQALFTRFMLPFEVAAVILTVAIVVAVMLTLRRRVGTKTQDPSRQVMVRREDRIRLLKMKAEPRQEGSP